jgi:multiple sugar transport system permease protein
MTAEHMAANAGAITLRRPEETKPLAVPYRRSNAGIAWAFVIPFVIVFAIFVLGPSLAVLTMSFTDWQLGERTVSFAGLENYSRLLTDRIPRNSAANTLIYALMVMPLSVAAGLWLAVLIESSRWGRGFFRSACFLPVVSTTVAMAVVWEFLLHPSLGPVNRFLMLIGLPPQNFLGNADLVLPTLAGIAIWENAGYNMVLFMAGLKAISPELYDAAAVDGADRPVERFLTVTLPQLGPTLVFVVIISLLRSFRVFETVAVLTEGGPRRASEVVLYTIYREGFVYFQIGYASAITVVFVLFLLVLTLLNFRLFDRSAHYQ